MADHHLLAGGSLTAVTGRGGRRRPDAPGSRARGSGWAGQADQSGVGARPMNCWPGSPAAAARPRPRSPSPAPSWSSSGTCSLTQPPGSPTSAPAAASPRGLRSPATPREEASRPRITIT